MACCIVSLRRWGSLIQDFAASGQLLHFSAALIIGDTFTKVMESLVDDLLTPVLGFLFDGTDIGDLSAKLQSNRWPRKTPVILPYGKFLQKLIYFAIIAIIFSIMIAIVNKIYKARRESPITTEQLPTRQELILIEHTNLLKAIAQ